MNSCIVLNFFISKKRLLLGVMISILLFLIHNINTYATPTGWHQEGGEYVYYVNGMIKADSIIETSGNYFYLDSAGHIVKDSMFEYEGNLYCALSNGALVRNSFYTVTEENAAKWLVSVGTYYFQNNAQAYKKKNEKIIYKLDGKNYIFSEEGLLLKGWIDSDGWLIDEGAEALTRGVYYAGEGGELYNNTWYDFSKDQNACSIGDNEKSAINTVSYADLDKMWIYFDKNCKKVKAESESRRKKIINGKEYGFDENGVMLTKFTTVGVIDYTQQSNPKTNNSVELFSDETNGSIRKNEWLWTYPTLEMDNDEHVNQECAWWRTDASGKIIKNKIRTINGKKYVFDGLGRMKVGFVLMSNGEYVANYQKDDLVSTDFIYDYESGHLYGYELSDIYYFGDDEVKDGSLKTGNVQIELADGIKTFGFHKSGICIGARGKLTKSLNSYYINGLRLDAKDDMKYGLVRVGTASEVNCEYKVVGTNGAINKAVHKVIKDEYDNYMLVNNGTLLRYIKFNDLPSENCTIKYWKGGNVKDEDGEIIQYPPAFYYYDNDKEASKNRYHYGAVDTTSIYLPDKDVDKLPESMKLNFS